jgi:hypothetical protein
VEKQSVYSVIVCGWSPVDSMWVSYVKGTIAYDLTWEQALQIARVRNKNLGRARKSLRIFPALQASAGVQQYIRLALAC